MITDPRDLVSWMLKHPDVIELYATRFGSQIDVHIALRKPPIDSEAAMGGNGGEEPAGD